MLAVLPDCGADCGAVCLSGGASGKAAVLALSGGREPAWYYYEPRAVGVAFVVVFGDADLHGGIIYQGNS